MIELRDGEWRLSYPGTSYTFGTTATPVWHRTTPDLGDVEIRSADVDRPRQDGRAFGMDYRGGRTITFDMGIRGRTPEAVREEASALQRAWRADAVRQTPGAVAELRIHYNGRERLVYGRPRRLALDFSEVAVNQYVGVVADFACVDDLFYAPDLNGVGFGIVPSLGGGLTAPLRSPLSTTATSDRSQGFRVSSEMPAWPIITVDGPISNAVVTIGPDVRIEVRQDIGVGETVVIDTQPWARTAIRNGTANVAGSLRGTRLSQASLLSGAYDVGLKGTDPTGTAAVRVDWRAVYSSL